MSSPHADFQDGTGADLGDEWQPPAWTQVEADGSLPGFPLAEPFPHPAIEPVLPTRWDALDGGTGAAATDDQWTETWSDAPAWDAPVPAADTDTSTSFDASVDTSTSVDTDTTSPDDPVWNDEPWGTAAFTDAPADPDLDVPVVTAAPLDEVLTTNAGPTLYDDAYRVAFRLTGRREESHAVASSALRDVVPDGTARVHAVMVNAVAGARSADLGDPSRITYRQHRERLRRELGRHSERDQAILALRHLVGAPAVAVAARLGLHESVVREVASAWRPADSRGDSSALLRGIDSWISTGLAAAEDASGGAELAHLDDPGD